MWFSAKAGCLLSWVAGSHSLDAEALAPGKEGLLSLIVRLFVVENLCEGLCLHCVHMVKSG